MDFRSRRACTFITRCPTKGSAYPCPSRSRFGKVSSASRDGRTEDPETARIAEILSAIESVEVSVERVRGAVVGGNGEVERRKANN